MKVVSARLDDDLWQWLKSQAEAVGWTESQMLRYILETTRGDDATASAIRQTVWAVQARIRADLNKVGPQIVALLEREVVDTWRELDDDPGQAPAAAAPARQPRQATGPLPEDFEPMAPEPAELHGAPRATTRRRRSRGRRGGR